MPGALYDGNDGFCGIERVVPAIALGAAASGFCKWPQRRIRYYEAMNLPGMARNDVATTYDRAWRQWAEVCAIEPARLPSIVGAHVAAGMGPIDGPWNTLALSYLPCGATEDTQLTQQYDTGEKWSAEFLLPCACHEIGHALGLSHLGAGNLMAPVLDRGITKPQPGDIIEIRTRYGAPGTVPTPIPIPESLTLDGTFREYTLEPGEDKRFAFKVPGQWFANQRRVHFTVSGSPPIVQTVYGRRGRALFRGDVMFSVKLMPGSYSLGITAPGGQGGPFHLAARLG